MNRLIFIRMWLLLVEAASGSGAKRRLGGGIGVDQRSMVVTLEITVFANRKELRSFGVALSKALRRGEKTIRVMLNAAKEGRQGAISLACRKKRRLTIQIKSSSATALLKPFKDDAAAESIKKYATWFMDKVATLKRYECEGGYRFSDFHNLGKKKCGGLMYSNYNMRHHHALLEVLKARDNHAHEWEDFLMIDCTGTENIPDRCRDTLLSLLCRFKQKVNGINEAVRMELEARYGEKKRVFSGESGFIICHNARAKDKHVAIGSIICDSKNKHCFEGVHSWLKEGNSNDSGSGDKCGLWRLKEALYGYITSKCKMLADHMNDPSCIDIYSTDISRVCRKKETLLAVHFVFRMSTAGKPPAALCCVVDRLKALLGSFVLSPTAEQGTLMSLGERSNATGMIASVLRDGVLSLTYFQGKRFKDCGLPFRVISGMSYFYHRSSSVPGEDGPSEDTAGVGDSIIVDNIPGDRECLYSPRRPAFIVFALR
jgi:hypothetical protein